MTTRCLARLIPVVVLLLIAACHPIVPAPAPAASSATPAAAAETEASQAPEAAPDTKCLAIASDGSITNCVPHLRDAACSRIVAFDDVQAVAPNKPVGWSFAVNFNVQGSSGPLACLRLYHVDETQTPPIMAPIDHGGILVDTCTDADAVTDYARGVARFCGAGSVTCEMDLGQWFSDDAVQEYVDSSDLGASLGTAGSEVEALTSEDIDSATGSALYPSLSLVAKEGWAPPSVLLGENVPPDPADASCALTGQPQHLFSFAPEGQPAQHELALKAEGDGLLFFDFEGCSSGGMLWNPADTWNTTYSYLVSTATGNRRFFQNLDGDPSSVTCGPLDVQEAAEFWLGPGTLTIGANGAVGFDGVVDGILIDPKDSAPPGWDP